MTEPTQKPSKLEVALASLKLINKLASPNPSRTFDDMIRDMDRIVDLARFAITSADAASSECCGGEIYPGIELGEEVWRCRDCAKEVF